MKTRLLSIAALPILLLAFSSTSSCQTQHQAQLNWTASTTPSVTYNVYRAATAGGEKFGSPLATGVSALTYTDTSVTAGQNVCYTVTAVSGSNESAFSNEACGTVPTNPNAPSALILTIK